MVEVCGPTSGGGTREVSVSVLPKTTRTPANMVSRTVPGEVSTAGLLARSRRSLLCRTWLRDLLSICPAQPTAQVQYSRIAHAICPTTLRPSVTLEPTAAWNEAGRR